MVLLVSVAVAAAAAGKTSSGLVRRLRVSHIMLSLDSHPQLEQLEQQLTGGAEFGDLARAHSICPSGRRGGELGWMSPGQLLPGFEEAVEDAGVGEVRRATTARGLHLIKVLEERREAEVQQMSVNELQEMLADPEQREQLQLLDVREEGEFRISRLPLFQLLPLSQAAAWAPTIAETLTPEVETIVLCHHGVRSMQAAMFLVSKGFTNVKNVTGGIAAYSLIDPSVPEY
eukprot:gene10018-10173_t